jgi:hypothetical protein
MLCRFTIELPPEVERIENRLERVDVRPEEAFRVASLPLDFLAGLSDARAPVPRGRRLVALAEALGTSVSCLVGLDPDVKPPQELVEEDQTFLEILAGDEEARAYHLDMPSRAILVLLVSRWQNLSRRRQNIPVQASRGLSASDR